MTGPREIAEALYRSEGLALPPIAPRGAPLKQVADTAFATRDLRWTLYDFERFVDELRAGDPAPYVAFGFGGHGLVSQAVHAYLVGERTAFLLQLRWGSALDRPEADRKRYHGMLAAADRLRGWADEAAAAGRFPAGQRLVVAQSSFHGSRWGWMPRRAGAEAQWKWSRDLAPLEAAAALRRLADGRPAAVPA